MTSNRSFCSKSLWKTGHCRHSRRSPAKSMLCSTTRTNCLRSCRQPLQASHQHRQRPPFLQQSARRRQRGVDVQVRVCRWIVFVVARQRGLVWLLGKAQQTAATVVFKNSKKLKLNIFFISICFVCYLLIFWIKTKAVKWEYRAFTSSARRDELALSHWEQKSAPVKDYRFAKLNKRVRVLDYTDEQVCLLCLFFFR